jgi:urease accessory protein
MRRTAFPFHRRIPLRDGRTIALDGKPRPEACQTGLAWAQREKVGTKHAAKRFIVMPLIRTMLSNRALRMSARIAASAAAPLAMLAAGAAFAHPGHPGGEHQAGFAAGFAHPFGGLDHLLAMLAVGLWAVQQAARSGTRRALWLLPAAFVAAMALGFALADVALEGVETGIALSVLILGLIVAFAVRLPLVVAMALTAGFALFHGHAHGTEMADASMALSYGLGMVLATALLHGLGLVAAAASQRIALPVLTRAAGAATALAGIVILVG